MERAPDVPAEAVPPRPPAGASRPLLVTLVVVVAALAVVVAMLTYRLGAVSDTLSAASASPSPTETPPPTVPEIFQAVGPSVVVINAGDSIGAGVVAADDGTILTADHVIAGEKDITVTFADGTKARAKVTASNPAQDIATLLPAELPEILVPAVLGGSADVGGSVVAIGNPLGLTYSVSTGVISGLDRSTDIKSRGVAGLIQFDASVNPGSSGGPLLNEQGLVIGIVVSIADPGKDQAFAGIAFAVPIGAALGGTEGEGPGSSGRI
ncbi:S1C family serine protease [Nonomuraea sp. NPDC050663]|uniref:S1C family serine protease n=1 Tax=Nonomuraea sp. NPDC050663 TaxID=3364370 RepID=UPI00379DBA0C